VGNVSLEMEKVLSTMPGDQKAKAERVLEINPNHKIFETMRGLWETDKDKIKTYSFILYNEALLMEGLTIEDPTKFSEAICDLM
ncbi:MAG: molecular chaperone HtpG, partial [Oscillospiraceae bacterium]